MENLIKKILNDAKVELEEEFRENFHRKGFFEEGTWEHSIRGKRGRTMLDSGNLLRSISGEVKGESIEFSSSLPYASIHNEGGEITVTQRMKNFFWAKHIQSRDINAKDAEFFKAMALKKVGSKIKIPKRQFIGEHQKVFDTIDKIVLENLDEYFKNLKIPKS